MSAKLATKTVWTELSDDLRIAPVETLINGKPKASVLNHPQSPSACR